MQGRRWFNDVAITLVLAILLIDAVNLGLTGRAVLLGGVLAGSIAEEIYRNWGRS